MKVIGLTGGIGSGKSTVARFLAELGAVVIDADQLGHEALSPGTGGWREVVAAFGRHILAPSGEIDRERLGEVVFRHPQSRERLNRIMHPRILEMVKAKVEEYRRQGAKVVVLEVPLLIEAGWNFLADEVWVTLAPEATVLSRLRGRAGFSEEQSLRRIRSQLSPDERIKHADAVINTDCSLEELRKKVEELWERLPADGSTQPETA